MIIGFKDFWHSFHNVKVVLFWRWLTEKRLAAGQLILRKAFGYFG